MSSIVVGDMTILMDVTAYVKWENRAKREGKTVAQLISFFLAETGTTNP